MNKPTYLSAPYAMIRLPDGEIIRGVLDKLISNKAEDWCACKIDGVIYMTSWGNVCVFTEKPLDWEY